MNACLIIVLCVELAVDITRRCGKRNDYSTEQSTGGASFFEWGGQRGAKTFLGGKSIWLPITHFNNTGHIAYSISRSSPPFPLISLFSLLLMVPFLSISLSFPSPAPPLIQLGVWGSAVSFPSGSAKWNLVNSGPRNERFRFLTCQGGKLQCSLNSLIYVLDSAVWTVLVSSHMRYSLMWVSKTPIPTWFWSFQKRFPLLKN